jgi:hypothetical protein
LSHGQRRRREGGPPSTARWCAVWARGVVGRFLSQGELEGCAVWESAAPLAGRRATIDGAGGRFKQSCDCDAADEAAGRRGEGERGERTK